MPLPVKDVAFQVIPAPSVAPTALTVARENQVTLVAATDTQLLAANAGRRQFSLQNLTGATLFLTFDGAAAAASSYPLPSGASFSFCVTNDNRMMLGEVRGFSTLGGVVGRLEQN